MKRPNRLLLVTALGGLAVLACLVVLAVSVGSDWRSFWPDVILALVTGFAVGAALLLAQTTVDRRRRARDALDSWFTLKVRLSALVVTTMQAQFFAGDLRDVSRWLAPLRELAEGVPLGVWLPLLDDPIADDLNLIAANSFDLELAGKAIENSMPRFPGDTASAEEISMTVRLVAIGSEELNAGLPNDHPVFERMTGGPLGYLIPEYRRIFEETSAAYNRLVGAFDDDLRRGVRWSSH